MVPVKLKEEKFSPFPGLRPFGPDESEYFFGRENESEVIAAKLLRNRFIAVTGASGSGKSSLVICGLMPVIRGLSAKGEGIWRILSMRPGNDPFGNLADAFAGNIFGTGHEKEFRGEILNLLKEGTEGIAEVMRRQSAIINGRVILFIDQFEELFFGRSSGAETGSRPEVSKFINLLTNAITHVNPDFYLVIALRSDLLTECAYYRSFTNLINNSNFLVSKMNRESIREAITGPVRNSGAEIDPDLVELLIGEVNDRADQLPVLQHALMRTWMHWRELDEPERPLDFSDYFSIGTMRDAISRHADEVYDKLDPDRKKICERLFKIITGKGSDSKGVSYPSNFNDLRSAISCSADELSEVIEEFRNPSLSVLTPHYSVRLDEKSVIDISHVSIIHLWERLKKWVEEESSSVEMYLWLSEASALYQQGKKGLLKQPELQLALNWRDQNKPTIWWARKFNPAFERAMVYLRTSEKEFKETEERKLRHSRRRLSRIKIISSILGGFAIVAALITVAAFVSKLSADNRRRIAEKQKEDIAAQKNASDQYASVVLKKSVQADSSALAASRREQMEKILRLNAENQILLSKEEIDEAKRLSESAIQVSLLANMNADSAIQLKNETQRLRMITVAKSMALRSLQVPEQNDLQALLAYQGYLFNKKNSGNKNDADIYSGLYTLAKEKGSGKIKSYTGIESPVRSIAFVPGKNEFYASDSRGRVLKWDTGNKEQNFRVIYSGDEVIEVMAVSPGSDWLACGGSGSGIKMIPVSDSEQQYELKGHSGKIKSLVFSFDGKFLYSAAIDGKVIKWNLSARSYIEVSADMMQITSIDLSSNNRFIAGISNQGKGLVWSPDQSSEKFRIEPLGKRISNLRFKPGENKIAVGYDDGTVEFWDIDRREKISEFRAHDGEINDIRFNGRFSQMATAGTDGKLKLWDTDDLVAPPVIFADKEDPVISFEFSPDGEVILSGTSGNQPRLSSRPAFVDSFAADGCSYVTRNFTPEEWQSYVGKDIKYEKTCTGADYNIKIREIR